MTKNLQPKLVTNGGVIEKDAISSSVSSKQDLHSPEIDSGDREAKTECDRSNIPTAPDNLREKILKRWLEKDLSAVMAA